MITQLVSNDFFISVIMALVVAILGFPVVMAVILFVLRNNRRHASEKK